MREKPQVHPLGTATIAESCQQHEWRSGEKRQEETNETKHEKGTPEREEQQLGEAVVKSSSHATKVEILLYAICV